MFLKVFIISVILVFVVMLALGMRMFFNPNAGYSTHTCALDTDIFDKDGNCSNCQLKELTGCSENKENKLVKNNVKSNETSL